VAAGVSSCKGLPGGAAGLRPGAARVQAQRGGVLPRSRHGLDLQHRVLVQAQLGLVGKDQGHARRFARAHEVAGGQGLRLAGGAPIGRARGALVASALQAEDFRRRARRQGGACRQNGKGDGRGQQGRDNGPGRSSGHGAHLGCDEAEIMRCRPPCDHHRRGRKQRKCHEAGAKKPGGENLQKFH